jgi:hypothetical protein
VFFRPTCSASCRAALLAILAAACSAPGDTAPAVLSRAHSHNDYLRERPLFDALDAGFCSVEADVFPVDGTLLVAHDRSGLRADRDLDSLYLAPLFERHCAQGAIHAGSDGDFTLLVDIKADAELAYSLLRALLEPYRAMLTRLEGGELVPSSVTLILSGSRPRATLAAECDRLAFMDGRLADLAGEPRAGAELIPLVSDRFGRVFEWRGEGAFPEEDRDRLSELVARAHRQGRRLRFWAVPGGEAGWEILRAGGVDLIGTDEPEHLARFLRER